MLLRFRKFQEGGAMAPEEQGGAPMEQQASVEQENAAPEQQQGGGDPMEQILQAAVYAVQKQDCKTALDVCQVLVQLAQQGAQGGAPGAPEQSAANQGEPVYRRGGRLIRRIRY